MLHILTVPVIRVRVGRHSVIQYSTSRSTLLYKHHVGDDSDTLNKTASSSSLRMVSSESITHLLNGMHRPGSVTGTSSPLDLQHDVVTPSSTPGQCVLDFFMF
jgi:hypothetical protein